jgi:hypothetical protein
MMEQPTDLTAQWDAALSKLGRAAVIHKLYVSGLRDPVRRYVEEWLGRQEAASDEAAHARHGQAMHRSTIAICLSLIAPMIAILALWRKW